MTPNFPQAPIAADEYEARIERIICRGEDLYDLDGETIFRNRRDAIETGSWEVEP